jgi:hypothetical protein
VVYELIGERRKALLASLFLAVLPFHVYQTSHAAPLTIGHFFMMLSLYFFLKFRKDTRYVLPLLGSTVLLVMSHHLTTYFYLITLVMVIVAENAGRTVWTNTIKNDVIYVSVASGIIFSYWMFVATPIFQTFMSSLRIGSFQLGSVFLLIAFYVVFLLLLGVVWVKRRYHLFRQVQQPTPKSSALKFSIAFIICLTAILVFSIVKMPWTNFRFTPISVVFSIPLLIMIAFGVAGYRYTLFSKNGLFVRGWIIALLGSFIFVLLTGNGTLPPDRHLEYIMVPLSIIAVYGLQGIFSNVSTESLTRLRKTKVHLPRLPEKIPRVIQKRQIVYFIVIILLVTTNAVSVYPGFVSLNAANEEITSENMAVIQWMEHHLNKNTSIIASDHRLARMTEAVGFHTTLDEAKTIWETQNLTDYLTELVGVGRNYTRITHVLIDDIMKNQVVHVGYGEIYYMTNASYQKFSSPLFTLLYRNETVNQDGIVIRWAEVYAVNWSYFPRNAQKPWFLL